MTIKGRIKSGLTIVFMSYFIFLPILFVLFAFERVPFNGFLIAIGLSSWVIFAFGFLIGDD